MQKQGFPRTRADYHNRHNIDRMTRRERNFYILCAIVAFAIIIMSYSGQTP